MGVVLVWKGKRLIFCLGFKQIRGNLNGELQRRGGKAWEFFFFLWLFCGEKKEEKFGGMMYGKRGEGEGRLCVCSGWGEEWVGGICVCVCGWRLGLLLLNI